MIRRSITVRMTLGTGLVLLVVLGTVFFVRQHQNVQARRLELRQHADLTARVVMKSFEAVNPGSQPAHTDHLARNLVELPDIHNILVIDIQGRVAYSHHPDEIGQQFEPTRDSLCTGCHRADGVIKGTREFRARDGSPVFHEGFAIPNDTSCQRCHDPKYATLGMLLMSLELSPFYRELGRLRSAMAWSTVAAFAACLTALALLFRFLIRRPLARLEDDIRRLDAGQDVSLVGPESLDEIGRLHGTFLGMAARLGDARRAVEDRLKQGEQRIGSLSSELDVLYSNLMHLEHLSAMGTLSAQMAHEIRTPLNAMALNLQLLERSLAQAATHDKHSELLAGVGGEIERIVDILNHFMSRARRPDAGTGREPLKPVVESAAFLMRAEARRNGISIDAEIGPELDDVLVHGNHLRQILANLLVNAIQASPAGGCIRVEAFTNLDDSPCLSVQDSGPGVPMDQRERIFEPFHTTRKDGTGLGLSITRHIVEECGGTIEVDDSPMGGARFTVVLGSCWGRPGKEQEAT